MIARPMLAATAKTERDLRFPLACTPKLDGIRCLITPDGPRTRAFKPVPNRYVNELLAEVPVGYDGELMLNVHGADFNDVQSAVMRRDGEPNVVFYAFDDFAHPGGYWDRAYSLEPRGIAQPLLPAAIHDLAEFLEYERACLEAGYEGVIGRDATGPYRPGRSTLSEHWMVKWKRHEDGEAIVLGFEESVENCNPQVPNAFGLMRRPGGSALKFPKGVLGSLAVQDLATGVEFGVGSGFDDELRAEIWNDKAAYVGRVVKYRCQSRTRDGRPRFPRFLGFRAPEDLS